MRTVNSPTTQQLVNTQLNSAAQKATAIFEQKFLA